MMKKGLLLLCVCVMCGCTYGQDYLEHPGTIIRDPHFAEYQKNLDDLERQYLHKEITYAEYIQQKDELDETYEWEVQERNRKIISPER
jgi:hypothetical protein